MPLPVDQELLKRVTPKISEQDKQNIILYYNGYEKYLSEINEELTAKLIDHAVFGDMIKNTPKEIMEENNKISQKLQKEAIFEDKWTEYTEYQIQQGIVYAKIGFSFASWYELISMVRVFMVPYLIKEYGNSQKFLDAMNGMNYFMDVAMGIIAEAYIAEKNDVILKDKEKIRELNLDLEQRIIAAKEHTAELETINNELNAFTYSVSHDLRAPLRAINGYAQILSEDYGVNIDDEGKRLIEIICFNATKMGILIDELLAFSRLGRKEINKTMVNMHDLTKNVIEEYNSASPNHASIKIDKLEEVQADYSLMHQVMFNLVSNAVKYSSKKEKPVVEISSEKKDKEVIYTIKDNGAGFDMKYSDKLFGVFQRLHSQEEFEGIGVGLALVHRIISKHHGKIWAESKVNEGATFHFSLKTA